jgi:shikimate kinase
VPQVILTGFMATGKTEVGRRLARALGRPFVDTDGLVEAGAGRSVPEIFATAGEARFRELEREAVARACEMPDAVVATGGGTLLDPENRRRLAAAGPIVCLAAAPETILLRIGNPATRPLLVNGNGRPGGIGRIQALLAERAEAYAMATHTVDTTDLSVDEVVERVRTLVAGR